MAYCLNHDATTIPKFAKYARNVWHLEGDDEIIAHQAVKATHDFLKSLGIPMTLPEVGITTDELVSDMSAQAVQHGHLTQSAYVALENDDVAEIIRASFEEMTDF